MSQSLVHRRGRRYGVCMYPSSTWAASDDVRRLLTELLERVTAEPQAPLPAIPRSAPRNMLDPKQAG